MDWKGGEGLYKEQNGSLGGVEKTKDLYPEFGSY